MNGQVMYRNWLEQYWWEVCVPWIALIGLALVGAVALYLCACSAVNWWRRRK